MKRMHGTYEFIIVRAFAQHLTALCCVTRQLAFQLPQDLSPNQFCIEALDVYPFLL